MCTGLSVGRQGYPTPIIQYNQSMSKNSQSDWMVEHISKRVLSVLVYWRISNEDTVTCRLSDCHDYKDPKIHFHDREHCFFYPSDYIVRLRRMKISLVIYRDRIQSRASERKLEDFFSSILVNQEKADDFWTFRLNSWKRERADMVGKLVI